MRTIRVMLFLTVLLVFSGFMPGGEPKEERTAISAVKAGGINWLDFAAANKLSVANDKKYLIYVYTDWCGWCKKMSSNTFQDQEVINLLNSKFNSVKFNAESKDSISFHGRNFKFIANGRRGYHELAAALLNNKLSYPTIVFLDEKMNMIQAIPGYRSPEDLTVILRYLGDKIYETMSFDDYVESVGG